MHEQLFGDYSELAIYDIINVMVKYRHLCGAHCNLCIYPNYFQLNMSKWCTMYVSCTAKIMINSQTPMTAVKAKKKNLKLSTSKYRS